MELSTGDRVSASTAGRKVVEQLRSILDTAVGGIITMDETGKIETVNPAVERIFGHEPSNLVGENVRTLIPELFDGVEAGRQSEQLAGGEPNILGVGREVEGQRDDGTTVPVELAMCEVQAGGRRLYTAFVRDIRERKRLEEALRMSEERFSKAFRGSPDALLMTRIEGDILEVNDGFEEIFGYTREEVTGRTTEDLRLYERMEDRDRALALFTENGYLSDFSVDLRTKSGEVRHTTLSSERITLEDEPCLLAIIRDETDRRNAERALQESEKRYRAIFELSAVGQTELELPTRRFLAVNRRFCEITGYSHDELLTMTVADVTHPDDRAYDMERFERTLTGGQREHFSEKRYLRRDGTIRWVDVRGRLMRDQEGEPTRLVEIISDITDRRAAEQALRESEQELREMNESLEQRVAQRTDELLRANRTLAQRNRELHDFANVASHDLREPLRKIQTFADLIENDFGSALGGEGRQYLERMRAVASRMTELLSDLRSFSRLTSGGDQFVRVDLDDVIREVLSDLEIRILDSGGDVNVGSLPSVRGVSSQLRQLFQNLIENALKFQRPGEAPMVRVAAAPQDESGVIRIFVADNGIGFDPVFAERIFVPSQRLHRRSAYEGTGMGLAICRRIVEHHGGTITAESREGEGAQFTVTFPAVDILDATPLGDSEGEPR